MTATHIHVDTDCGHCGTAAVERTCSNCGATAIITDCGHKAQPRPIAAGRADGSDAGNDYCEDCARPSHTYSVYDVNPQGGGSPWPSHDNLPMWADSLEEAAEMAIDVAVIAALDSNEYDVGDLVWVNVWDANGIVNTYSAEIYESVKCECECNCGETATCTESVHLCNECADYSMWEVE